jgi:hypothetical protein
MHCDTEIHCLVPDNQVPVRFNGRARHWNKVPIRHLAPRIVSLLK